MENEQVDKYKAVYLLDKVILRAIQDFVNLSELNLASNEYISAQNWIFVKGRKKLTDFEVLCKLGGYDSEKLRDCIKYCIKRKLEEKNVSKNKKAKVKCKVKHKIKRKIKCVVSSK